MKTICKYPILPPSTKIAMPIGAMIVAIHEQEDGIFMWAEVEPYNALETRHFVVYATGENIEGDPEYRGTIFMKSGFVFHVYEVYDD